MNMTWPSASAQRAPAATNASAVAFSMISIDSSMKIRLRRTSTPISPSANRIAARSNACSIGTAAVIPILRRVACAATSRSCLRRGPTLRGLVGGRRGRRLPGAGSALRGPRIEDPPDAIRADEAREEQHRRELDGEQIRPEKPRGHGAGADRLARRRAELADREQIHELDQQD